MAERHLSVVEDAESEKAPDVVEQFREQNLAALHELMYDLTHIPAHIREMGR